MPSGLSARAVEPRPDVVHEHVEARQGPGEPTGEGADLGLRREVRELEVDRVVAGLRPEGGDAPLALGHVAPDDDQHPGPVAGEQPGGHQADAVRRPRHEAYPVAHPSHPAGSVPRAAGLTAARGAAHPPPSPAAKSSFIPSFRHLAGGGEGQVPGRDEPVAARALVRGEGPRAVGA